jgi:hypothetical protein
MAIGGVTPMSDERDRLEREMRMFVEELRDVFCERDALLSREQFIEQLIRDGFDPARVDAGVDEVIRERDANLARRAKTDPILAMMLRADADTRQQIFGLAKDLALSPTLVQSALLDVLRAEVARAEASGEPGPDDAFVKELLGSCRRTGKVEGAVGLARQAHLVANWDDDAHGVDTVPIWAVGWEIGGRIVEIGDEQDVYRTREEMIERAVAAGLERSQAESDVAQWIAERNSRNTRRARRDPLFSTWADQPERVQRRVRRAMRELGVECGLGQRILLRMFRTFAAGQDESAEDVRTLAGGTRVLKRLLDRCGVKPLEQGSEEP